MPGTISITIGQTTYEVAVPFGLDALEDAGDAIDKVQELLPEMAAHVAEGRNPPMKLLAKAGRAALEAFCIVINTQRPGSVDFQSIAARASLGDAQPMLRALTAALTGSGFVAGETGGKRKSANASPSKAKSKA